MRLIVGHGNPGSQYEHTRHHVGFDVLSLLADKLGVSVSKRRSNALIGETAYKGEKLILCAPQTYMNLSGEAVGELLRWYKLEPRQLIVIYDDIDLAPGWLRIRKNGGPGTHNGMRSIVSQICSEDFPRIRVGTGGKPPEYELADWVLSRYRTPEERQIAYDAYTKAADAVLECVENGADSAMNKFNTRKPKPEPVKPPEEDA